MSSLPQTLLCHYRYDALNRLIGHALPDTPVLQRFYCGNRLATEIEGALQRAVVQHGPQLLAQKEGQDDNWSTTLLGTDLQRSVLHTLKPNHQRHPIAFTPYGYCSTGSDLTSLLAYKGERPDSVIWHYLLGNGYRAYNPVLMRFNRSDSLSPFGEGGVNPYAYCLGDPINRYDPNGHYALWIAGKLKQWSMRAKTKLSAKLSRSTLAPRSLENVDFDSFKHISKFLEQGDMDNLAQVSKRLNDLSTEASRSNFKAYLEFHRRNRYNVPVSIGHRIATNSSAREVVHPRLQGVGSAALKQLDSTVMGRSSLREFNQRVRQDATADLRAGSGHVLSRESINESHADRLLRLLE
ncbi:RHS repeat-associated core domain-containing protein [Pseudomonas sp. G(2018)]|uniref:RHS repeat-associated core domain-containing protein n=1 Tax=Pseudomonas sp. G(2018) TaxID=2502242 RepID=UPI0010F65771|nr:RHS repeat-associated core domain-containing protein [Pseudomonas sp. G(2018)]